jgi:hypothetical protein
MKKNEELIAFCLKLTIWIFIILTAITVYSIMINYSSKYFPPPQKSNHKSNIFRSKNGLINSDIIFFGSSRTSLQINPRVVENFIGLSSHNLGEAGSNIVQITYTLKNYLENNIKPRCVFVEADIMLLDSSILRSRLEEFDLNLQDFGGIYHWVNYEIKKLRKSRRNFIYMYRKIFFSNKIFTTLKDSLYIPSSTDPRYYIKGSHLKKGSQNFSFSDISLRNYTFESRTINNRNNKYYQKIVDICDEYDVLLIFLTYPRFEGELKISEREFLNNYFQSIAKESNNIFYWNYINEKTLVEDFQKVKKYWWNIGHLNYTGANKFSKIIGDELKKILL